ncbi:hypothetical protein JCM19294_576 [Nonlabens tegetincola]|uniref:Uncharacterized protein n=1 Tax=Nonlabens tegetincola TaxID=323273 RepID=A0A090Q244_9FLAO|nr:hypothetical protein [Nonlabens tegetincola]GAK97070.1 hypothetical protein JCM19294_576 [Nonlabens tegetincola]
MRILFLTLLLTISFYAKGQNDSIPKDAVHLREVPKHNLVIDLGLSSPTGDYKDVAVSGLNIGAGYDFYMDKHWLLRPALDMYIMSSHPSEALNKQLLTMKKTGVPLL